MLFFSHLFCTLRPNMEWKSSVMGPEPTGNAVNKKNQLMSVEMNQDPRTTCDMVYSSFCRNWAVVSFFWAVFSKCPCTLFCGSFLIKIILFLWLLLITYEKFHHPFFSPGFIIWVFYLVLFFFFWMTLHCWFSTLSGFGVPKLSWLI